MKDKESAGGGVAGEAAGYTTLLPQAPAGPFAGMGWPEVCDFNVLEKFQRRGIGSRILAVAEDLASQTSGTICLGVGLHSGYGTAQRLYVKRGYVFDGSGLWYRDKPLEQYAPCAADDDLVLYLSKKNWSAGSSVPSPRRSWFRSCSAASTASRLWKSAGARWRASGW